MVEISKVLWDENGHFLGRDFNSWAKILGFYALYYTFLGFLFYGFTITYYLDSRVLSANPVGGKPAVLNPRLDMPGAVVHPFKEMMEERGDINKFNVDKKLANEYCTALDGFFQQKKELNLDSVDCSSSEHDTTTGTCTVSTAITLGKNEIELSKELDFSSCSTLMERKNPMFAIDINKIIGWAPNKAGIHFQCFEYDSKSGKKLQEQKFKFRWLSKSSISSDFFPYNGVSSDQLILLPKDNQDNLGEAAEPCDTNECAKNKPYNKPFVAGMIEGEFVGEHFFRCDILSDKINAQFSGNSEEDKANNADLRKLGLGFVEFGYQFKY
jgi:hypothetical protein